jgi:hypothetical protein
MPTRKTLRKILVIGVIILMICGGLYLAGAYVIAHALSGVAEFIGSDPEELGCLEKKDKSHIEARANITLPLSSQNLSARSIAFRDCRVFVSFDMDPADLETFLASTYVSELKTVIGSDLTDFNTPLKAWSFWIGRQYLHGEGHDEGFREYQEIVIDRVSPELYTVYVITHLL